MTQNRRAFVGKTGLVLGGGILLPTLLTSCNTTNKESDNSVSSIDTLSSTGNVKAGKELFFKISLAEWSYHKALFAKEFTNLEFPAKASELGINAVEYVSVFFEGNETKQEYLAELKKRSDDLGVRNVLIMVDREGFLGDLDEAKRIQSVENHYKWIAAAKYLGCHSIRVNAHGEGTAEEVKEAAIDGLGRLSAYGAEQGIGVIVENHGGYSSNGEWLSEVIAQVNNPFCGTLPDFGNFRTAENEFYDHYLGVEQMMPFAKGVSAKSHAFGNGEKSNVTTNAAFTPTKEIDYDRMMEIVKNAGYTGYVGIEFEGNELPEKEGILKTKAILERVGARLSTL